MSVTKVLWVTSAAGDFIMFQLNESSFIQPCKKFPKAAGWFCTLGLKSQHRFVAEPRINPVISSRNGPDHVNVAKDIDGTSHFYTTICFNTISPPGGNIHNFAVNLFYYANNFDRQPAEARGDYQHGIRDGVSWTNSLFKKAGVPASVRQKGGNSFLPHTMLFDAALFDPKPYSVSPVLPAPGNGPKLAPGHEIYIVKPGDSLSKIAKNRYNDYKLWEKLYKYKDPHNDLWNLNKIGGNPNLIFPKTPLIIPPINALR